MEITEEKIASINNRAERFNGTLTYNVDGSVTMTKDGVEVYSGTPANMREVREIFRNEIRN